MSTGTRYLLRRFGFYVLAALFAITINFVVVRLMPGDPATALLGRLKGELDPESIAALREAFGLSEGTWFSQYMSYLSSTLSGDLGISIAYFPQPLSEVMASGLRWTVFLQGLSVTISFTLGTTLGMIAAWRRGSWLDSVLPPGLALIGAFPYFWTAMLLLGWLGYSMGAVPVRHAYAESVSPGWNWPFIASMFQHAALPAAVTVVTSLGGWLMAMRSTMIGVLGTKSIELAYAKGLDERRIMLHYAARNALLPNVTGFGMALGFVLTGSLLTEIIFSYPGQGFLLIQAIRAQDVPLILALFLTITLAVLLASWLADVASVLLDPRIRTGSSR